MSIFQLFTSKDFLKMAENGTTVPDPDTNNPIVKKSPKKRLQSGQPVNHSPQKKLRLQMPQATQNGSSKTNGAKPKTKFIYGNYNGYYGYRLEKNIEDVRLTALTNYADLFNGKELLDIGCNDGSLTIALAKRLSINFIVGIDIDAKLIARARNNVTHETQAIRNNNDKNIIVDTKFPQNIAFKQFNYVLSNDSLLDLEEPRYDTILCLSVTKWIHLNFGDDGLKRAFKRMYRSLKENGTLILEAQSWNSYKRRKNLTPEINVNFKNIKLHPENFQEYLLSSEIGFINSYAIELSAEHSANGFKRPIIAYTKGAQAQQKENV